MNRTRKIKITELNPHVICVLCGGYYINATTITECLHSFCRTCITRYLETSKYCPVCDVMVHKTRPLEYIRSDKTLQDLVYKLVPGLYKMEMKRRREYYSTHDHSEVPHPPSEDRGCEFYDRIIYTEDEKMSLSLELCAEGIPFKTPSTIHGHSGPENIKIKDVRYLQCPAAFSVGNIKKFIRMKFDLKQKYEIDVFHTAEPLLDYYTLMDIAYIYTWTRRAPLRLYYTVYVHKERPRVPETIARPQPVTVSDSHVIDTQRVNCEHHVEPDKENLETKTAKRKFPDGPGDISPDLELEKKRPVFNESRRKDSSAPRKRAKKQVVYDSSVLEAMSESEEQLAKLTLGGDDEGAKTDKNKQQTADSDTSGASVNNTGETDSESLTDNTTDRVEAENGDSTGKELNVSKSVDHIILSPFQPLNVSTKDKNATNGCVYEFSNETTDKPEVSKPKGKPGKKKKVADSSKTVSSKISGDTSSNINTADVNKNPGHNQDKASPVKKNQNIKQDQNGKIAKKRGRPPGKKVIKTDKDEKETEAKVKRKYVRKNVKKQGESVESLDKASNNCVQSDKKQSPVNEACEKVDKLCVNGNDKSETGLNAGAVNKLGNADPGGHLHTNSNTDKDVDVASDRKSVTETQDSNTEMATHSSEAVREPTTPLYGQTPKAMAETQGLPVSPNPDCAESGSTNNGANCDIGHDGKTGDMKSVNKNSDVTKCAYRPVGLSEPTGSGYNSGGVPHIGVPVIVPSVSPSHLTPGAFTGYNSCGTVSGNSNGYTRNGVQTNMASFSENMSPLSPMSPMSPMSPPGVCVMASYQRLTDPLTGHPVTNGYSPMDQSSDQPLDLTNNGHREEYTKGKIFKTKLLKKNYAKADNVPNTKDKTNTQTANGLISSPWV